MALDEINFKILIADENIQFRNNLGSRLRLLGYTVEFVTGGFHLLHLLEKFKDYSLVILHEDMLDMPAEEILLLVRTSRNKADLPILFISQGHDADEIRAMVQKGANEYIVKIANFQPIVEKVTKYFNFFKNS